MGVGEGSGAPVRTKAIIIDPGTMKVLWVNEAAAGTPSAGSAVSAGDPVERAVPLAGQLGVVPAIERVAASGEAFHAHADVIPTRRGSMVLAISIYRLPDASVLVLAENAWEYAERPASGIGRPARGRR